MSTFPPPALYAASARETSPLYFFKFCAISLAPPIIFCCASYAFVTPSPFAVDGISCMTPMAPAELVADGLKLDSCLAMALSRLISTPYVSEASLKYSSRFSGEETLPEEVVLFVAEELEIEPGDELVSVSGKEIEDILDYHYLMNDEYVELLIRKSNGEEWELEIEKEYEDDIGIEFENGLMDNYRSCHNKCIFCFIDQMPPGMRETLYFKDDDSRLSFLQGNYVTLTNMSDHDIDRIVYYHMEPMNISFQTMNPDLRCKMLHNRFAGEALKKVDRFYEAGIHMNGQIVLCKGVNDGAELDFSIRELTKYLPYLQSVSVVPVGLSKYRDGLFPLEPFDKEDAKKVLDLIHGWQEKVCQEYGIHFIHASDEWYILAGQPFPPAEQYDGYLQLENGVGMMRLLLDEVKEEMENVLKMAVTLEVDTNIGNTWYDAK